MDKENINRYNGENEMRGWKYDGTPDTMREVLVIWRWKKHPNWPESCSLAIFNQSVKDWTFEIVTANKEDQTTSQWGFRRSVDREVICWCDIPRYKEKDGHVFGTPIE